MKKLVLTGAAGHLGSYLREPLTKQCDQLISTDIQSDLSPLYDGEIYVQADLADFDALSDIIEGADMVVHFGAHVDEDCFERLLEPNFIGSYNIWEAARRHKTRRVIYASSIHAVGMYPKQNFINTDVAHRPDTFYGLSKCFTENLGRMYWEKCNIESVHLRILSCTEVTNTRALGTWLSYDDLIQLVERAIETPTVGFSIIYGVSNNDRTPVDNSKAAYLGYRPKDNAEQFAPKILSAAPVANTLDLSQTCHGGPFASTELGKSPMAQMGIINKHKKPDAS